MGKSVIGYVSECIKIFQVRRGDRSNIS